MIKKLVGVLIADRFEFAGCIDLSSGQGWASQVGPAVEGVSPVKVAKKGRANQK